MRAAVAARYGSKLRQEDVAVSFAAADAYGLPRALLLVSLLQESQFYHGGPFERAWTSTFLLARRLPLSRLRQKSLGIASLKPRTAVRLLRDVYGVRVPERLAAEAVARDRPLSIWLAAAELASFKARGASDLTAFLAYAATSPTAEELLADVCAVLERSHAFRRRRDAYAQYLPIARRLADAVSPGTAAVRSSPTRYVPPAGTARERVAPRRPRVPGRPSRRS